MINRMWLSLLLISIMGCAQHHCRRPPDSLPPVAGLNGAPEGQDMKNERRVRVYKYDGSLQCGMGKPVPVERMAEELKGIKIYSSEKKPDGLMHIQVCGSATGMTNVYEISESDLTKAERIGFKKWTFE